MKIISRRVRSSKDLARLRYDLSGKAKQRLKWFDYYNTHRHNARLTCRYFGITPQTFYRWKKRFDPFHLESLEDHSHRPKHVRKPTWAEAEVKAVLALREEYPRWGKDKLVLLLKERNYTLSASMVGRILSYLKRRGVLKEPVSNYVSTRKRQRNRPYATRKPKDYKAKQAGDIVQLDTLDIRPLPGVILKHYTAHDVISKWDVLDVYTR
ncbi:helix-turn-helix domain-containing protein, partial [Chloroflexota bacterium]